MGAVRLVSNLWRGTVHRVLNQWFSNKERGTLYGIWFSAHNIGTGLTYIITAYIVGAFGWQMGFFRAGIAGDYRGGVSVFVHV
jgi:sugar phosphate permease